MPIYEYICDSCRAKFEMMRSMSRAEENAPCPRCQGLSKRVISRFARVCSNDGGMGDFSPSPSPSSSSCSSCGSASCSTCGG